MFVFLAIWQQCEMCQTEEKKRKYNKDFGLLNFSYCILLLLIGVEKVKIMAPLTLPPLPPALKSIQHYLKIASDYDTRDPPVSYWSES